MYFVNVKQHGCWISVVANSNKSLKSYLMQQLFVQNCKDYFTLHNDCIAVVITISFNEHQSMYLWLPIIHKNNSKARIAFNQPFYPKLSSWLIQLILLYLSPASHFTIMCHSCPVEYQMSINHWRQILIIAILLKLSVRP